MSQYIPDELMFGCAGVRVCAREWGCACVFGWVVGVEWVGGRCGCVSTCVGGGCMFCPTTLFSVLASGLT